MNEHLSQAISLKLHDAGIVVESASGYIQANKAVKPHVVERVKCPFAHIIYPAPTFTELWRILPRYLKDGGRFKSELKMWKRGQAMVIGYQKMAEEYDVFEDTPVEALGLLALWLVENGHLKEDG